MLKKINDIIGENITMNMTIDIKDGQIFMIVTFKPKVDDSAFNNLAPIQITGTPETVEEELLNFLSLPVLNQMVETVNGVSDFEKSLNEASANTKQAEAIKKKFDDLIKKGEEHLKKKEIVSAKKVLADMEKLDGADKLKKFKDFKESLIKLEAETQPTMFSDDPDESFNQAPAQHTELKLDADVEVREHHSRAIQFGIHNFDDEQIEIIQQERYDKLDQYGNNSVTEDF